MNRQLCTHMSPWRGKVVGTVKLSNSSDKTTNTIPKHLQLSYKNTSLSFPDLNFYKLIRIRLIK